VRIDEMGNARLLIPVSSGLPYEFAFQGNTAFTDRELERLFHSTGDERFDPAGLDALARRIEAAYRRVGFADARASASFRLLRAQRRGIILFTIVEGLPLRVRHVTFTGANHFSSDRLRQELFALLREAAAQGEESPRPNGAFIVGGPTIDRGTARPFIPPEQLYIEPIYQEAIGRIQAGYQADGFLQAKVELQPLERDVELPGEARVSFVVTEGVQTRVTQLDLSEIPEGLSKHALEEVLPQRLGAPFNPALQGAAKSALERALHAKGYLFASVEESVELVDGDRGAHLYFRLDPGPRVKVGHIVIEGHERTSEHVVRAALALREGELITPDALQKSQRTLVRLGIFRTARVALDAPDIAEPVKDLVVRLEERKTWFFSVGAGFSLMDGARVTAEMGKINLFGQALQLQIQGKVNFLKLSPLPGVRDAQDGLDAIGRKLNLGLIYPHAFWLMPLDVALRTNLVHEYLLRPSYTFQRTAAVLGADVAAFSKLSVSLQYELEEVIVHRLNTADDANILWIDRERLRFEEGRVYLHSIRPIVRLDFRDNTISPRRGFLLMTQVELVQSLNSPGDQIEPFFFLKLSGMAATYIPLPARSVLALSVSAGKVFPLDASGTSRTIVPKRFFVGGANSLRGFMDDALIPEDQRRALHREQAECELKGTCESLDKFTSEGGELFTLARAELRIPLTSQFDMALFFDAGNLWLDQERFNPLALRYATGIGLRMATPIGPAALDLGINLNPDDSVGESRFVPHFSIGLF
ncbi:MAG: BamA/TamA family outer membrane protein, partial [Myxococcales bacterium]|jgi:outer membrane protein assembly complex protein YaeT|nr:BamA/TamA family outer membrane protein [Myxococcales bacterium]